MTQATLRAVHNAFVKAQVTASNSHNNFEKFKYQKEMLLQKGREYISRGRGSKNTTLEAEGKAFIRKGNLLDDRIKKSYHDYMESEAEMARLNNLVTNS